MIDEMILEYRPDLVGMSKYGMNRTSTIYLIIHQIQLHYRWLL
jgi:hypothetical protein